MSNSSRLVLHCGAFAASLDQVLAVPTPPRTATYEPLPYGDLIGWIMESAQASGLTPKNSIVKVKREDGKIESVEQPIQLGLSRDGQKLFFLVDFENQLDGHSYSVGGRTSHDKSIAAAIAAGARNFVCDNMALAGDLTVFQKHDAGADFRRLVNAALAGMPGRIEKLISNIERLKQKEIRSTSDAKAIVLDCALKEVIAPTALKAVWSEFINPKHPEFAETFSQYRLLQAMTEVEKKSTSAEVSINRYLKYAQFFDL